MTQVQANVNIPHPTQPQPHAWRSINFMTQVQEHVNMPHPTQPQPHAWRSINFMTQVQTNVDMPHPTPPNPNLMRDVASTSWRKCKRTLTCPTPPHPAPTPRGLRWHVTKMSNLWAGKRSDCIYLYELICLWVSNCDVNGPRKRHKNPPSMSGPFQGRAS